MTDIFAEHADMVASLCKPGDKIVETLNPETAHLLHMAVGIAGEAGELLDAIKKVAVYNKDVDIENVREELGDLEFYMEGLRAGLGLTRDECLNANVNKLLKGEKARYKSGAYSDKQAQDRADKQEEVNVD